MIFDRSTTPDGTRVRHLHSHSSDDLRIVKWEGRTCRILYENGRQANHFPEGYDARNYTLISRGSKRRLLVLLP